MVERSAVNRLVESSNLSPGANFIFMPEIQPGSVIVLRYAWRGTINTNVRGLQANTVIANVILTVIKVHNITSVRLYNEHTDSVFTITTFDGVFTAYKTDIITVI